MPLFAYKVIDKDGIAKEGELTADNEEILLDKLRDHGYTVIDVRVKEEEAKPDTLTQDIGFSLEFGVSQKALVFFTRQLAITLNAGLPLTRIITTLYNQTSSKFMKKILRSIGKDIQLGESLSVAMGKHKKVFDSMYLSMIAVGEASGTLPRCVNKLAEMMEKDQAIRRKVGAALTYPLFVITFSAILCYVLIAMLMPGFIPMFKTSGLDIENEYPITHFLMQLSQFLTNPVIIGITIAVLILLIVGINLMNRSNRGRYIVDFIKFHFPFINSIIRTGIVTRFCRSFAILMNSGVPLLKTMELVSSASGNEVVSSAIERMAREIQEGERVSKVLKRSNIFPELVVQMVSVGEEAGNIPEMLERTGEYFEQELESIIESLTSLLEPVMMIAVGTIVGLFIMGIILPIMGIVSKFGQ